MRGTVPVIIPCADSMRVTDTLQQSCLKYIKGGTV